MRARSLRVFAHPAFCEGENRVPAMAGQRFDPLDNGWV